VLLNRTGSGNGMGWRFRVEFICFTTIALACLIGFLPYSHPASANQNTTISSPMPLPSLSPVAAEKRAAIVERFGGSWRKYLEDLKGKKDYLAPSQIDRRYTIAFYVNASGRGKFAQRMWVLQRDEVGGTWKLGLWDTQHWGKKNFPPSLTPPYSWLVSTGRKYPGDKRSGPTPTGVFSIDERRYRLARGYAAPGMINVVYIDLHYSGGRRSGVAFHGTTYGRYRRLGSIDSHGCIRMTKKNALAVLDRLQGRDGVLSKELRWGDVPRYWQSQRGGTRYGYTRSGVAWPMGEERTVSTNAFRPLSDIAQSAQVLTKTGYRAIAIIFRD
jgi:hypothetical protein